VVLRRIALGGGVAPNQHEQNDGAQLHDQHVPPGEQVAEAQPDRGGSAAAAAAMHGGAGKERCVVVLCINPNMQRRSGGYPYPPSAPLLRPSSCVGAPQISCCPRRPPCFLLLSALCLRGVRAN
jgi:hypothetical protein